MTESPDIDETIEWLQYTKFSKKYVIPILKQIEARSTEQWITAVLWSLANKTKNR